MRNGRKVGFGRWRLLVRDHRLGSVLVRLLRVLWCRLRVLLLGELECRLLLLGLGLLEAKGALLLAKETPWVLLSLSLQRGEGVAGEGGLEPIVLDRKVVLELEGVLLIWRGRGGALLLVDERVRGVGGGGGGEGLGLERSEAEAGGEGEGWRAGARRGRLGWRSGDDEGTRQRGLSVRYRYGEIGGKCRENKGRRGVGLP